MPQDRRLVGEFADEVLAAQFGAIDAEFARRGFDQPFKDQGRLGPPGAAHRVDRHRVGVDRPDVDVDRGDRVLAGHQRAVEIGRDQRREERHVGAEIGDRVDLEPEHLVVLVERHLGRGDVVAAMGVGQERLAAARRPFDRPAGRLGRPQADDLLRIGEDLRAEAAADVGSDDPELVLRRDVDEGRQHDPQEVRILRRVPQGEMLVGRTVFGDHGAGFHRARHRPVVDDVDLDHVLGLGEGLVGRAVSPSSQSKIRFFGGWPCSHTAPSASNSWTAGASGFSASASRVTEGRIS